MNGTYMDAAPLASQDATAPHCCNAACQDGWQSSAPPQLNWLKVNQHAAVSTSVAEGQFAVESLYQKTAFIVSELYMYTSVTW